MRRQMPIRRLAGVSRSSARCPIALLKLPTGIYALSMRSRETLESVLLDFMDKLLALVMPARYGLAYERYHSCRQSQGPSDARP